MWRADFWTRLTLCPLAPIVNFGQTSEYHVEANTGGCEPGIAIIQFVLVSRHKSARPELLLIPTQIKKKEKKKKKSLDNVVDVVLKGKLEVMEEG